MAIAEQSSTLLDRRRAALTGLSCVLAIGCAYERDSEPPGTAPSASARPAQTTLARGALLGRVVPNASRRERPPSGPVPAGSARCDAPLATLGQRWSERLTTTIAFSNDPGPGNFRGKTQYQESQGIIEIVALDGRMPTRVALTQQVGTRWSSVELDAGTSQLDEQFWVGRRAWPVLVAGLQKAASGAIERIPKATREALGAALARRLASVLGDPSQGKSHVELGAAANVKLPWGDALVSPVEARGALGSSAAGELLFDELALSGQLRLRAEDAAFVSVVLEGRITRTEQWPALRTKYPPVPGRVTLRLERPCFATELREQQREQR
ncbi:MAG: hypothetical protein JW940_19610 [Polyangiaceae bacterium]|nr:hypothetical protein [Polyangiaceae bacterium]